MPSNSLVDTSALLRYQQITGAEVFGAFIDLIPVP
jgi:hypothetical protein